MKLLLVNAAADKLMVAVAVDDKIYKCDSNVAPKGHSAIINICIDEVIKKANVKLSEMDAYACCIGPGSFTGIRVGIATIKAFMLANPSKYIAVNSLEALAYNKHGDCIVAMPAGRGRYYTAAYFDGKEINAPEMVNDLPENAIIYDTKADYTDEFMAVAIAKYNKDEFVERLSPLYLQLCQAEEERNKKLKFSSAFTIKKLDNSYVPELVEGEKVCFPLDAWNEEMLKETFDYETNTIYGLFMEKEFAGYAMTQVAFEDLYISNIAVMPLYRRCGGAEKIMEYIIEEWKNKGVKRLLLEVRISNSNAIAFYEKLKFQKIATRRHYYENGESAYTMQLII